MQDHRFRAWDHQRNEFLSGGQIFISVEPGKRPKCNHIYLDILKDPDTYRARFTIEQCSGICAKDGKAIYEGDVVIYEDFIAKYIGVVNLGEWKQDGSGGEYSPVSCYGFFIKRIKCINDDENWMPEYKENVSILSQQLHEVIGNIHENPKLLIA